MGRKHPWLSSFEARKKERVPQDDGCAQPRKLPPVFLVTSATIFDPIASIS